MIHPSAESIIEVGGCGLSWGGFNLYGNLESIKEVQRLQHCEARMEYLQKEVIAARNRIADDAGLPVEHCPDCGLSLNSDHTHRTYEEHDRCRNTREQA